MCGFLLPTRWPLTWQKLMGLDSGRLALLGTQNTSSFYRAGRLGSPSANRFPITGNLSLSQLFVLCATQWKFISREFFSNVAWKRCEAAAELIPIKSYMSNLILLISTR